jgi:iron complex transport system ATP-binding protein
MRSPILVTKNLRVGYGQRVLFESLSLSLAAGSFVCLIGANGAGKSTLLRTLAGLNRPQGGEIYLQGEDLYGISAAQRARRLSLVLTDRVDLDWITVEELVALGRHPYTDWRGRLDPTDREIVQGAIASVGLSELSQKAITHISDGERQKAMIARALAQQTDLMILDEPTAYLDLPRRVEVMQLLRSLAHSQRRTMLMSTHDLDLALRSADQLWLITERGNLLVGTPEELVLEGYLGATFNSENFRFDQESGQFQLHDQRRSPIVFEGEGLKATWTVRTLIRLGFELVPTDADLRLIFDPTTETWNLYQGDRLQAPSQIFTSLGELTAHLQALQ